VRHITDAPIQWLATRGGPLASPILCGDLIRAFRVESEIARTACETGMKASFVVS
jgi:hypothetical protein